MGRQFALEETTLPRQIKSGTPGKFWPKLWRKKADFLSKHPKHKKFQIEIDGILDKAGSADNRMTVLAMLMEGKLIELQSELKKLNAILLRTAT